MSGRLIPVSDSGSRIAQDGKQRWRLYPAPSEVRFAFGANWLDYLQTVDADRVGQAARCLEQLTGSLAGKTFLDVGCGSGIHSLAALTLGARTVTSFDADPQSCEAACRLRGEIADWAILQGSILDAAFTSTLGTADVVYAWGVLHHTGNAVAALRATCRLVRPGGLLAVALYDPETIPHAEAWLAVKRRYNAAGPLERRWMEIAYAVRFFLPHPLRAWRYMRDYRQSRGMDWWHDVRDWLGGWPMEYVRRPAVKEICEAEGLALDRMVTGNANTEYVCHRP